ncbi:hypothetical protein LPB72_02225 [Hydrogenophaga crassostreae]|nr:hypothetical protein LPB72_02225 [Hydrogenophaga crassostreae]
MPDLTLAVFAKTPLGQQEIQSRSMGLAPLVRRILVLIDGKRGFPDLAALLPEGSDAGKILQELLAHGCVQVMSQLKTAPVSVSQEAPVASTAQAPAATSGTSHSRSGLPPASSRSPKDNEMARNFMINSINAIIGQNMRISLIHDIFHSDTTEKLREVYEAWESSLANTGMGAKRLPELRDKLFKVL